MRNDRIKWIAEQVAPTLQLYYVGGCVRDEIMGRAVEDTDICVVGTTSSNIHLLIDAVNKVGEMGDMVGRLFPVWCAHIGHKKVDIALARRESKGEGKERQCFDVDTEGVTIEEDLKRRDFTINAIAINVLTNKIVDPYGGRLDIELGALTPVGPAFCEDPLRVLRGARFCARFALYPTQDFYDYAKSMVHMHISQERIGEELRKVMEQTRYPSIFFNILKKADWLNRCFPFVHDTIDVPQTFLHHPEGDVYNHTMLCIDCPTILNRPMLRIAMLCHDLGKSLTTKDKGDGKFSSIGHEEVSVIMAETMLKSLRVFNKEMINKVKVLCSLHMIRINLTLLSVKRAIRKLEQVGLRWEHLCAVCEADKNGRGKEWEKLDMLQTEANSLYDDMGWMQPVVTGDWLVGEGYPQNEKMGKVIRKCLVLQDKGTLTPQNKSFIVKQLFKQL